MIFVILIFFYFVIIRRRLFLDIILINLKHEIAVSKESLHYLKAIEFLICAIILFILMCTTVFIKNKT